MIKKAYLALLLPLLLICCNVSAQTPIFSVSYDSSTVVSPTLVQYGDSIQITFNVSNVGTVDFNGDLVINRSIDSVQFYRLDSITGVSIPAGGSYTVNTADTIFSARYDGGINILVIWPTAMGSSGVIPTIDTVFGEVYVDTTIMGVKAPAPSRIPIIYPNPAQDKLFLQIPTNGPMPVSMKLVGIDGRIVRNIEGNPSEIDLYGLPDGIWMLNIRFRDGTLSRHKVIIAR